uniref:Uncharacterized protein n=1 Tax=Glossina morsitans morsitans TaxID=37546 RepID=A0ABK9MQQ6_GLOMM
MMILPNPYSGRSREERERRVCSPRDVLQTLVPENSFAKLKSSASKELIARNFNLNMR